MRRLESNLWSSHELSHWEIEELHNYVSEKEPAFSES